MAQAWDVPEPRAGFLCVFGAWRAHIRHRDGRGEQLVEGEVSTSGQGNAGLRKTKHVD